MKQSRIEIRSTGRIRRAQVILLCPVALIAAVWSFSQARQAHAFGGSLVCICSCAITAASVTASLVIAEHTNTRLVSFGTTHPIPPWVGGPAGLGRLGQHQNFLLWELFEDRILPAMMMMTEQFTAVMMKQAFIIGTFFDAKHQMESLLLFQQLAAEAHKDYHPSYSLCEFGTSVRSLAAAEHNAQFNAFAMNKAYLDRQLGTYYHSAAEGAHIDRSDNQNAHQAGRVGQYRRNFCNFRDMNQWSGPNTGLFFCDQEQPLTSANVNLDIDFTRLVMLPRIINADFSDNSMDSGSDNLTVPSNDHAALLAMSKNLYGHDVFSRDRFSWDVDAHHNVYIDTRSVIAKRGVAQNSFNNIVALKTRGTSAVNQEGRSAAGGRAASNSNDSGQYLKVILEQLGGRDVWDEAALNFPTTTSPDGAFNRYLTGRHEDVGELSYYAQMEFLAKKLYQRPEFYTNLYDKPANVRRQSVAMRAISLMLNRDIYDSWLRSEMLLSMILETKILFEQDRVQGELKTAIQ